MAFIQNDKKPLRTPGTEKIITNTVPIFDDVRILKFLRRHAPSLLEYTASIGMRKIIAEVPMTCGYTICAGVWKMMECLDTNKSELFLKTFETLVNNYEIFIGKYFDHILPHLKQQDNGNTSYYIANNGITNMLGPLIRIYKSNKNDETLSFVPDILRALYSYEIWQAVRRRYKNNENSDDIIKETLHKLLGIDLENNKTRLTPLFEAEPDGKSIKYYDKLNVNMEYFEEITKSFFYIKYVNLIPDLLSAIASKDIEAVKNIPRLNDEYIKAKLDINYDLRTFILYNIVQSLLYKDKSSRLDSEKESMKIPDLKDESKGEEATREYIKKQFHSKYLSELAAKKRTEQKEIAKILTDAILTSNSIDEIISLFKNGVKRGIVSYKIVNSSSLGYSDLKKTLTDLNNGKSVPLRTEIIKVFLLCRDSKNEPVWNNGGINFVYNLTDFGNVFKEMNKSEEWELIFKEYKERGLHIYRELMNRHGHGNSKPSYWAFGYPTLQHYKDDVSEEDFKKYCEVHAKCCGVAQILALVQPLLDANE